MGSGFGTSPAAASPASPNPGPASRPRPGALPRARPRHRHTHPSAPPRRDTSPHRPTVKLPSQSRPAAPVSPGRDPHPGRTAHEPAPATSPAPLESTPAAPAITLDDTVVPYGMLAQGAARVAGWLQDLGVQPGDRVAVSLPNIPHMPIVYYGILWAGGVVVPMNPLYKSREVAFVLSDSEARALFAWDGVAEEAGKGAAEAGAEFIPVVPAEFLGQVMAHEPVAMVERDDQDTAVVLYTSGTTGTPKGAELTHTNMARNAEISVGLVDVETQRRRLRRPAAVPLVRADRRDERGHLGRREPDPHPPVRADEGPGGPAA